MLARIRKAQQENEGGFTLIELLVVMIIIGILAAIAIPVFLSQRAKAQDSAAKADVSTIGKEVATYYVDNTAPPTVTLTADRRFSLQAAAVAASAGPPAVTASPAVPAQDIGKASANSTLAAQFFIDSTAWCVTVLNAKGDKARTGYKDSAAGGLSEGTCANAAG